MAKNTILRINRNLGRRLREARQEVGLSLMAVAAALAAALPKTIAVSHTTISSYESGTTTPPIDVLAALAMIYKRTLNWFLEDREELQGFRYRNLKSRVSLPDKRQFQAMAAKWVEAYVRLESQIGKELKKEIDMGVIDQTTSPAVLAMGLRSALGIKDCDPVQNMIAVLELCGIRVIELRTPLRIDGLAARFGSDFVVVLNPSTSNDRLRMNAAHELAHVLYDDCKHGGWTDSFVERRAYEFASVLLLPDSQLQRAFDGRSFLKLLQFKERFGISVAAMIYRAEKRRLIPTSMSRRLWKEMSQRGWRKNEPGYVWRDRAIRFETLLEAAVNADGISWSDVERVTGISTDELQMRISQATEYGSAPRAEEDGNDEPLILRVGDAADFDDP